MNRARSSHPGTISAALGARKSRTARLDAAPVAATRPGARFFGYLATFMIMPAVASIQ
jgi:hypothetical protein